MNENDLFYTFIVCLMGVIGRESVKYTMVHLVGVLIGTVSTLLIYPLQREAYGLARFLIDFSILMYPFVLLGYENVAIKFFPRYSDTAEMRSHFLGYMIRLVLMGCGLLILVALMFGKAILRWLDAAVGMRFLEDAWIADYIWLTVPMICLMGVAWLFNQYLTNFHKILVPAIFQNAIKVSLPILILLYHYHWAGVDVVAYGLLGHFMLIALLYIVYIRLLGELNLSWSIGNSGILDQRQMWNFALYSLFGSLGTLIAFRIDSIMISALLGLQNNGDFGIAATIAQTISIPTNAIITASAPVIAAAWTQVDMDKIQSVYKKSSLHLLIPGLWIYTGMWVCLDDLLSLMPSGDELSYVKGVILILGFARIVDMATSVNNEIIAYSKYYRFNFWAVLFLACCNIVFNLFFIRKFGIAGAAMATALSLVLYNVLKFIFIWISFGIQPFDNKTLQVVAIAIATFLLIRFLPGTGYALWDLIWKIGLVTLCFGISVRILKLSPHVDHYFDRLWERIKR